ncbi:acyltransferase family protein [Bradyrhizobium elkanii]|uniref:acyltransferase family protein n=1 Tax=Bradyrhizobium elkanii TaxID=29448 RepID=UPI0027150A9B|nr:acyltransferase [Bradyrhizobium elkanii]WLB82405.1 acyltransferase [Bradyrhizobium elkanii]
MKHSSGLDAIRGVAIGLVLIRHLFVEIYPDSLLAKLFVLSACGVDLFFVLSGFLIGGILMDNRDKQNYFEIFYVRRALRILPLYALLVIPICNLVGEPLLPFLTFTQNFLWADGRVGNPLTVITWSLAVEEQFYLVLPAIVRFWPTGRLLHLIVALICAAPIARIVLNHAYGDTAPAYFLLPARMDGLFLGVLAAFLIRMPRSNRWLNEHRRELYAGALLLALPVILMTWLISWQQVDGRSPLMQYLGYSAPPLLFFVVLLLVVTGEQGVPAILSPLCWLGLGAYSLYLTHRICLFLAIGVVGQYISAIALALSVLASLVLWRLVEKPFMTFGRERFRYKDRDGDLASIRPA